MHTLLQTQLRAKAAKLVATAFSFLAMTLCGASMIGATMGLVLIGSPACEGETFPGYALLLVSLLLFVGTSYHLWYVKQVQELERAQLQAEAELAEDIEAFRELTPQEQHLMGRMYQQRQRKENRVRVVADYDEILDEPDYDNMAQDFEDQRHYSQQPVY